MELLLGPENPTLTERFVDFFRLPYVLSSAVLAFLIASATVFLVLRPYISPAGLLSYVWLTWVLAGFYSFYAPRYMRSRLLEIEKSVASLLPGGENDFHDLFGSVSDLKPQLVLWVGISSVNFTTFLRLGFPVVLYPLVLGIVLLISIGISSIIWTYIGSLRGIHKMGRAALRFTPFYKDRIMGLRDVGSLALALAITYFGFLSLSFLLTLYSDDALLWTIMGFLVVVGVAMFFLPLRGLHLRMVEQKKIEREKLNRELEEVFEGKNNHTSEDMSRMFRLDIMRRELTSAATWPYDIQILSKLTIVSMSLAAALLSRVIAAIIGM